MPHFVLIWPESLAEAPVADLGARAARAPPSSRPAAPTSTSCASRLRTGWRSAASSAASKAETLACGTGVLARRPPSACCSISRSLPLSATTLGGFTLTVDGQTVDSALRNWSLAGDARILGTVELTPEAGLPAPSRSALVGLSRRHSQLPFAKLARLMTRAFRPVDEQLEVLRRGAVDLVSEADLARKLERSRKTGKPLAVKTGFDPSSPDLHLGHTVLLRKMRHFQQLGHRVIFLIGDFTGMIGDPTGKKATRPQLTREQVLANAETYKRQVFKVLDREATVIRYNGEWLTPLGAEGIIRLAGKWTLARMMERDDFRTRFREQQPISLHELLYPLVQAKDSVEMAKIPELGCDVELGGHDQIFNLLVGRDLMKEEGLEPQVCLTVPLLVGLDGHEKMSKSLGNAIAVEDSPKEIYGKTLSIPDTLMWDWLLLLTDLAEERDRRQEERRRGGRTAPEARQAGARASPGRRLPRRCGRG